MTSQSPAARRSYYRFLAAYEPLRTELYRYCRYLTRSPWDAEDLTQDTLARAFALLAHTEDDPQNPRSLLFRVASHLWIDQLRRRREVGTSEPEDAAPIAVPDARESREA